jgi:geranylgeranyldiphosphate transferase/dimethylallyldiphosphate transferase
LQNDCKNIYSEEYALNKGAIAEDLRNGELSFPVVIALNDAQTRSQMQAAFQSIDEGSIAAALAGLQSPRVRMACLHALEEAGRGMEKLVAVWGRRENLGDAASGPSKLLASGDNANIVTTSVGAE